MSARDDLVAAMEAFGEYDAMPRADRTDLDEATVMLTALTFLRNHGKHLLALLDAEPVAGPAGCVCWQSSEWLIPPEKILPACDSFHKGKYGLCDVCDHAEACHARPEASDE